MVKSHKEENKCSFIKLNRLTFEALEISSSVLYFQKFSTEEEIKSKIWYYAKSEVFVYEHNLVKQQTNIKWWAGRLLYTKEFSVGQWQLWLSINEEIPIIFCVLSEICSTCGANANVLSSIKRRYLARFSQGIEGPHSEKNPIIFQ
jgi:hypothetical protein